MRFFMVLWAALCLALSGCSDDTEERLDGGEADAALQDAEGPATPDTKVSRSDGLTPLTLCGPRGKSCDTATEICVGMGPIGPTDVFSCEAVPPGCLEDRTCKCVGDKLCNAGDTCVDVKVNEIYCDNGSQ